MVATLYSLLHLGHPTNLMMNKLAWDVGLGSDSARHAEIQGRRLLVSHIVIWYFIGGREKARECLWMLPIVLAFRCINATAAQPRSATALHPHLRNFCALLPVHFIICPASRRENRSVFPATSSSTTTQILKLPLWSTKSLSTIFAYPNFSSVFLRLDCLFNSLYIRLLYFKD